MSVHRAARALLRALAVAVALIAVLPLAHAHSDAVRPRNINVGMTASWTVTPLLIEASEHIASIDQSLYWSFLTAIGDRLSSEPQTVEIDPTGASRNSVNDVLGRMSDKEQYELALSLSAQLIGPASLQVLRASLALHSHSVKAESYYELFTDELEGQLDSGDDRYHSTLAQLLMCEAVIVYDSEVGCGDTNIVDLSKPSSRRVYQFDHVYQSQSPTLPTSAPVNRTVIVYADLTKARFYDVHRHLLQMARDNEITYVVRPKFTVRTTSQPLSLQGWGVELAVKNMEYTVLDDRGQTYSHEPTGTDAHTDAPMTVKDRLLLDASDESMLASIAAMETEYQSNALHEKILIKDNKDYNLTNIGVQATQIILASTDPLKTLHTLTANFPAYASALTKVPIKSTTRRALDRKVIQPGTNLISLHGQSLSLEDFDIYSLMSLFHSQALLMDQFSAMMLTPNNARQLLAAANTGTGDSDEQALAMYGGGSDPSQFLVRLDLNSEEAQSAIHWLNDITKDARYNQWPQSLREFLTPSWGNQLKYVRQNVYTGVIVMDPSLKQSLHFFHQAMFFLKGNTPIRLGLIFTANTHTDSESGSNDSGESYGDWDSALLSPDQFSDLIQPTANTRTTNSTVSAIQLSVSAKIAKMFRYIEQTKSLDKAFDFLDILYDEQADITQASLVNCFLQFVPDALQNDLLHTVVVSDDTVGHFERQLHYLHNRGIQYDARPSMIVHGQQQFFDDDDKDFRTYLMEIIFTEQRKAGLRVYTNIFKDRMDIAEYWNSRPNAYSRLSYHILRPVTEQRFVHHLLPLSVPSSNGSKLVYLNSPDPDREFLVSGVSHWIVSDWETAHGLRLVIAALSHLVQGHGDYVSRVAFIHHPAAAPTVSSYYAGRLVSAIQRSTISPSKSLTYIRKIAMIAYHLIDTDHQQTKLALQRLIALEPKLAKFSTVLDSEPERLNPAVPSDYVSTSVGLKSGEMAIVSNGYITVMPNNATITDIVADLCLLDEFVSRNQLSGVLKPLVESFSFQSLDADDLTSDWYSDVTLAATFALAKRHAKQLPNQRVVGTVWPSVLDASEDSACVVHSSDNAWLELKVLLNPTSKEAQHLSGLLLALRQAFNITIQVFFNPPLAVESLPLKRFYQYAINLNTEFDGEHERPFRGAMFEGLQTRAVLTLTVDTPEPWLVGLSVAPYDLDNLKLDSVAVDQLRVDYSLEHLLINGQMFDTSSKQPGPPAGLQLKLSSPRHPFAGDTVVMQNLGYFQLKANPGVWSISFPHRHGEIYELHPTNNNLQLINPDDLSAITIPVLSLTEPYSRIFVRRRPGQEDAELLDSDDSDSDGGLISSLFHSSSRAKAKHATSENSASLTTKERETIHIFSLASGHLYERFLKIMMLSVIKHTQSPVKFWFIRNFASPQFVNFVPVMAEHYGFQVEFITYKWPVWLRRQEEKQRVIWGYKILFLDVLWPLKLERVIYIDADQIVRGDIKQLWAMDLHGAPYGYVPFCDSNPDTKGFRFWDSGYWKEHLRGKSYHISALYVIDLKKFRGTRAGDNLRAIYDNLSADPNSLANLDQDLPNYAQHMVPIYSLPQQWLWCQTWCSMESLSDAQTIDLCNNPLTKTPKLEVARTLLPEWTELDNEARSLEPLVQQKLSEQLRNASLMLSPQQRVRIQSMLQEELIKAAQRPREP